MSCQACDDTGIWPFVATDNPKAAADVTVDDLLFAICLCDVGQTWRERQNEGRQVAPLWLVWCAKNQISPKRICMIEDTLTSDQLAAKGLIQPPADAQSREAALLKAAKARAGSSVSGR